MTPWINATGVASVLTALFAMRYRVWRAPKTLAVYFVFFFLIELGVAYWWIPEGALGPEIGAVCLVLAALVSAAIFGIDRYEKATGEDG